MNRPPFTPDHPPVDPTNDVVSPLTPVFVVVSQIENRWMTN